MSLSKLKIFVKTCVCLSVLLLLPKSVFAQFITIANPVRISAYTKDSVKSLASEYSEVSKRNLPASWLFTYDVLENQQVTDFAKQMDQKQDLGIFLEVTPNFAKNAGVIYNKTDSWHRSNSVFLIGYSQDDRKKLIDVVFKKFKSDFGYYPRSVGAWWVDSFSLSYMKDKYGIIATLGCADQFYTDGYSLWGQYWSTPFYPAKFHAGMPARSIETKLDLVLLQWATRDPLNGYSGERASSYSTQDYYTRNLPDEYYEKLIKLYALKNKNQFGQITLGLEGDFPEETYREKFAQHLDTIQRISTKENITITNMKDFSLWYRQTFPNLSPAHVIEADDLLGSKIKSIWYQSPAYRIGLTYNEENQELKIIDWRTFQDNFQEPFYLTPNTQLNLYINTPSLIDQISNPRSVLKIPAKGIFSSSGSAQKFSLLFDNNPSLIFEEDKITLLKFNLPSAIKNSELLKVKDLSNSTEVSISEHWSIPAEGLTFRGLPPQFYYLLNSYNLSKPNTQKRLAIILLCLIVFLFATFRFRLYRRMVFKVFVATFFSGAILFIISQSRIYSVSQAETDALLHLKSLEPGKVIVYDETCLKCVWHNRYMPASFVNSRGYVSQISKKPIVRNRSIFVAKSRPDGKKKLDSLAAKYIYVVKYENYTESLPFSPGDYNVELIFENANAQIWRIKDNL